MVKNSDALRLEFVPFEFTSPHLGSTERVFVLFSIQAKASFLLLSFRYL